MRKSFFTTADPDLAVNYNAEVKKENGLSRRRRRLEGYYVEEDKTHFIIIVELPKQVKSAEEAQSLADLSE